MQNVEVRYYPNANVEALKSFYSKTPYRGIDSVKQSDEVVAAFEEDKMVGVFRLCHENAVCLLRGFNVLNEYQGKGIGSLMLMASKEKFHDRECYLICNRQLNALYEKVGFTTCSTPPEFLLDRKRTYNNPELNILIR